MRFPFFVLEDYSEKSDLSHIIKRLNYQEFKYFMQFGRSSGKITYETARYFVSVTFQNSI